MTPGEALPTALREDRGRDAELGRRYADKLAKVYARDGAETWVLIHVEVQGEPEARFAERMYIYHYRLFDRYSVDIVSLAVLADARPSFFGSSTGYCTFSSRWSESSCAN